MRILPAGCQPTEGDADMIVAVSLDRSGASRASLLAARLGAIVVRSSDEISGSAIGEVVRALMELERLLIRDEGRRIQLGAFLNRFVELRAVVAGRGVFRLIVAELPVDFALARSIGYIICDLVTVIETMESVDAPDVRIAVHPDGDQLVIAVAVDVSCDAAVLDLAGARAFNRAERLVASIGGSLVRGVEDGDTLFGAILPVADA